MIFTKASNASGRTKEPK